MSRCAAGATRALEQGREHEGRSERTHHCGRVILGMSLKNVVGCAVGVLGLVLAWPCAGQTQPIGVTCTTSAESCYAGDGVDYTVSVSGTSNPERPTIDAPAGLSLEFVGGSTRSSQSISLGSGGRRIEHVETGYVFQYRLTAARAGQFVVPPPRVNVNGKSYDGTPVRLRVLEPESDDGFSLSISVDNDTPYVGEAVTLRVFWRLASSVKNIAIAVVPGQDSFDLATPHDRVPSGQQNDPSRVEFPMFGRTVVGVWSEESVRGQTFRVLTVEQVIVPREAGSIELGPMSIAFDAVVGQRPRGFFDAPWDARDVTRRVVTRSNAVTMRVRPLPEAGRPAGFRGLVGKYSIKSSASAASVGVGDPFKLAVTIEGPDPLARVEVPALDDLGEFRGAFKASAEGWVAESAPESNPRQMSISIRATDANVASIPSLQLPYFDPERGEYRIAKSDPIPLNVRATRVVTTADGVGGGLRGPGPGGPPLAQSASGLLANSLSDDALRDEVWSPDDTATSPLGIAILAAPIAAFAGTAWIVRRGALARSPRRSLRIEGKRAAAALKQASEAAAVGDALQRFAGAVLGREPATLASEEATTGIGELWPALGHDLARLLRACDAARFGDSPVDTAALRAGALDWLGRAHQSVLRADRPNIGGGLSRPQEGIAPLNGVSR